MTDEKNTKLNEFHKVGELSYFPACRELRDGNGNVVHIRKQSADVLSLLVEFSGELVSKDFIIEKVWEGIVTTDDSLVQCIADIRRAVGKEVIQTFPKKGYKLTSSKHIHQQMTPVATQHYWPHVIAGCIALLALFILARELAGPGLLRSDTPVSDSLNSTGLSSQLPNDQSEHFQSVGSNKPVNPPPVSASETLAVLPFANLSGGSKNQFFSDGLSEDLATDLSKVPGLTVISFASSRGYPDADSGFANIAAELGVRYLVRGTIRHQEERVRINVSLVDPYNGSNLWTERYDKAQSNPFDIQEEVTQQIVSALSLKLNNEDSSRNRIDPGAYYMLLRGLEPLRTMTATGNMEARHYFEQALGLDPGYARAHASLAVTYARSLVHNSAETSYNEAIEKGLHSAVRAIQLDPDTPHAYFALGLLNLVLREYDTALAAIRHALEIDRNFSAGYALLAEVALYGGDLEEALVAIRRAKLLHPHHPPFYHWIEGNILFQQEYFEEAEHFFEHTVDLEPLFASGYISLAANYMRQDKVKDATELLTRLNSKYPELDVNDTVTQMPFRHEQRRDALLAALQLATP